MSPTIGSIKREAKVIKARDGFGHCQALEIAARKAGFNTYAAAKAALQGSRPGQERK
ncbi:hypothetical protein [Stenotrophomonas acidaminiphila]|uniref:hypothetical protein n=1 Tax=Stenotrophomonas acidaminiphila TaxID=128780 RepID=UPI0015F44921|nr:hypothetical protein [Stenotrophomonas acidaminiphila]